MGQTRSCTWEHVMTWLKINEQSERLPYVARYPLSKGPKEAGPVLVNNTESGTSGQQPQQVTTASKNDTHQ